MNQLLSFLSGVILCALFIAGVASQHDYPQQIRDLKAQHATDSQRLDEMYPKAVLWDSSTARVTRSKEHIKKLVDEKYNSRNENN